MQDPGLYDRDFVEWSAQNAQLLRAGRLEEADIEHIAEEIEDLGGNWKRALDSHMTVLLAHLLKWQFQPERRGSSWRSTIINQRVAIAKILRRTPSLQGQVMETLEENYRDSVAVAAAETNKPEETFPQQCPYTREEILDKEFLPGV